MPNEIIFEITYPAVVFDLYRGYSGWSGKSGYSGYSGYSGAKAPSALTKEKTIINPTASEDKSIFRTSVDITITKMVAVLIGSATPSVTWTIRHSGNRNATGNEVVTGGTITTSITSGNLVTIFNDATIPANSYVWLETTAQSGTVAELFVSIEFTED